MFTKISGRVLAVAVVIFLVITLSFFSTYIKGGKSEKKSADIPEITSETTIIDISAKTGIDLKSLNDAFGLKSNGSAASLKDLSIPVDRAVEIIKSTQILAAEHASKNWILILTKFVLWAFFLGTVFIMLKKNLMTSIRRKVILGLSFILFGVTLGADPSPMGTIKDGMILFIRDHVIFKPRIMAFSVMILLGTIFANKLICSWGCQFGTLQDFIFRLGRDKSDMAGIIPQFKVPFLISNTIRVLFLVSFTAAAFFIMIDIVAPIDPFMIFKPSALAITGAVFITLILVASLFVYRPWCYFLCPFGLAGWVAEKISIFKIRVNYSTCIACQKCATSCPGTVMKEILIRKKIIPDCFACGVCIESCPTKSISFSAGKRNLPPKDKFK